MWNMPAPPAALVLHDFAGPDCCSWVDANYPPIFNHCAPGMARECSRTLPWGIKARRGQLRLKGGGVGGLQEWIPPAFKRLPLMTRWLIALQSFLFVIGQIAPQHPLLGAGGGAISSLGFDPVQILWLSELAYYLCWRIGVDHPPFKRQLEPTKLFVRQSAIWALTVLQRCIYNIIPQAMMLKPFMHSRRRGDDVAMLLLQSYRAITHVLVHASLPHLIFNMLSFSAVGERLERLTGSVGLLQLVLALALASSLLLFGCQAVLALFFHARGQSR